LSPDARPRKRTGAAGAARERQVRELFRSRGYVVFKSSDSAVADVIAMRGWPEWRWARRDTITALQQRVRYEPITADELPEFFQHEPRLAEGYVLEVTANLGSPYMNFRAAERAALRAVAEQAGLDPLLVHWPPRGALREIPANEWPDDERRVA
jgi:hypothetical protein